MRTLPPAQDPQPGTLGVAPLQPVPGSLVRHGNQRPGRGLGTISDKSHGGDTAGGHVNSVTIFDVAAEAGVSTATVSRVANGHPNIKPETRKRVQDAMDRLGYVPNLRARGLAGGKTQVVGLLVDDLESSYIAQVAKSVDSTLSDEGYDLMVGTLHMRTDRTRYVHSLLNGLVEGLIVLLSPGFESILDDIGARGFPMVLIDHAPKADVPVINTMNIAGTADAVEHLFGLGHRRIAFVTGLLDVHSARVRLEAYEASLATLGIAEDHELIEQGDFLPGSGYRAAQSLLSLAEPPTAIIASSDTEALGVLRAARELGVDVPGELSVVGFDDIPEARYVDPGLTTVRQPMGEMGRTAARMLLDAIQNNEPTETSVEIPTELIVRGTTGPVRA